MHSMIQPLRLILRKLTRTPLFTAVAVLTLALGIGANVAVFTVINGVILKPLEFPESERLVGVWHRAPGLGWDRVNQSPALYFTYRDESQLFADSGMWDNSSVSVSGRGEPEQVSAIRVTDGTLPLLGVQPQLGRLFTAEDDSPGTAETVILAHEYWQRRLGGDRAVVGSTLTVNGTPREVIGVLPAGLSFLDREADLYLPMRFDRSEVFFGNFSYQGLARLEDGVSLEQANAEVERMIPIALDNFPMPPGFTRGMVHEAGFGPNLSPLKQDVVGDVGDVLWVLLGTVGVVLLVACANVTNLFLVRAEARHQELAIRSALGATRRQISGGLLAESLVLGLVGGALGVGLAWGGVRLLLRLEPRDLPRLDQIAIDPSVLLFALAITLLAALLFSAMPVLRLRLGKGLSLTLRESGRGGSAGRGRHRLRNALVVFQVAAALLLLIGSGLMIRSFQELRRVQPGFEQPAQLLTFRVAIPSAEEEDDVAVAQRYASLLSELAAIPGVERAAMVSSATMDGWDNNDPIFVEEFPLAGEQIPPLRRFKWVAPGYFETMGNPILVGRDISWSDIHERAKVALITRSLAREYWPEPEKAIGKRIRESPSGEWKTIVGVVGDVRDDGVDQQATATVFWPQVIENWWGQELYTPRSMVFVLRSDRVGTAGLMGDVRQAMAQVAPGLPMARVRTMEEILRRSTARTSFTLVMLAIAAVTGLALGAVGIYGVTSYVVAQRTREIGVRLALGARRRDISVLVLRFGMILAGVGVLLGLAAAAGLTRLMASLLFGVQPVDLPTFLAAGLGVAMIAVAAAYLPARRAAAVDPIETLRWE